MLEKEVFFAKFRTIILNIAEIHKSLVKKLTSDALIFKIVLKDWKIITVSNIERKYELCREINKIKRFLKLVKLVKNITFNSIKLTKIFTVTIIEKSRRTSGFCRQTFTGLTGSDRGLWERALISLEELHAVTNDNEEGIEEASFDAVEKNNGGKSNTRNCLCLLQVTPLL